MKINKKIIQKIKNFIKNKEENFLFEHTLRVRKLAFKIAKKEGGNKEIIEIAALLHDVSGFQPTLIEHRDKSILISKDFLIQEKFNKNIIDKVLKCIEKHLAFAKPETIEEKIIHDSDILELIGPFGILKICYLRAKRNFSFKDIIEQCKKVTEEASKSLYTKTGRRLASPLIKIQEKFFKQLDIQLKI